MGSFPLATNRIFNYIRDFPLHNCIVIFWKHY